MKIAITGHTAGIGKTFSSYLAKRGHDIIGISKRDGNNIRVIPKIVDMIKDCDMWINNAQAGYAQTELLYAVWKQWRDQKKMIWLISTMMTKSCRIPDISNVDLVDIAGYKNQKRALEDAFYELKNIKGSPLMCLIRPGSVATQPEKTADVDSAEVGKWVGTVCDFYIQCRKNNLWPEEISLGFRSTALDI